MKYHTITLELRDDHAVLTLTSPETRNAMTCQMGDEIADACSALTQQKAVRVLFITGQGPVFSSGGDLGYLEELCQKRTELERYSAMRQFYARFLAIRSIPQPTVALIQGHAIGAGLCFAAACDLRLAAESARLGVTFVKLGLHPGMGATFFLPRLIGPGVAADLLMTGKMISATEAKSLGLINQVVPDHELNSAAMDLLKQLNSSGPLSVTQLKQSLNGHLREELEAALHREAAAQAKNYATRDVLEGIQAARERRTPRFVGE